MSDYCKSVHFLLTETRSRGPLSTSLAQDLANKIKAVDGGVRDLLIFAHEAGNLMLANAINLGYLTLGSGTKWFEAQVSAMQAPPYSVVVVSHPPRVVPPAELVPIEPVCAFLQLCRRRGLGTGSHTPCFHRLAAWGENYCQHASIPSFFLFRSYYNVFNAGFPYCAGARRLLAGATPSPATGDGALAGLGSGQRQLSIGSGHTNLAWQALVMTDCHVPRRWLGGVALTACVDGCRRPIHPRTTSQPRLPS